MKKQTIAASAVALLLSGCFESKSPLMPEANMVVLSIDSKFMSPTGKGDECSPVKVSREDKGFKITRFIPTPFGGQPTESVHKMSFDELFPNWYLVQLQEQDGNRFKAQTSYRIARLIDPKDRPSWLAYDRSQTWVDYQPICSEEVAALENVFSDTTTDGQKRCRFSDYSQLEQEAQKQARKLAADDSTDDIKGVLLGKFKPKDKNRCAGWFR